MNKVLTVWSLSAFAICGMVLMAERSGRVRAQTRPVVAPAPTTSRVRLTNASRFNVHGRMFDAPAGACGPTSDRAT